MTTNTTKRVSHKIEWTLSQSQVAVPCTNGHENLGSAPVAEVTITGTGPEATMAFDCILSSAFDHCTNCSGDISAKAHKAAVQTLADRAFAMVRRYYAAQN
jgi:hypothetical protein